MLACQREGGECMRNWEGTQPAQLTQTGKKDIPYHMMSYSAYKPWGGWPRGQSLLGNRLGISQ